MHRVKPLAVLAVVSAEPAHTRVDTVESSIVVETLQRRQAQSLPLPPRSHYVLKSTLTLEHDSVFARTFAGESFLETMGANANFPHT
jgi:hypothetical protein